MTRTDYLKRLEEKINKAIEHIERLTLENQDLQAERDRLRASLKERQGELSQIRLEERERSSEVRAKIRSILHKVDSLNDLS